ncbi:MAG: hypothetical protein OXR67_08460 [Chloroflexota bacterium]|nr:hypothetical protein [Chloroflexota bacterium]
MAEPGFHIPNIKDLAKKVLSEVEGEFKGLEADAVSGLKKLAATEEGALKSLQAEAEGEIKKLVASGLARLEQAAEGAADKAIEAALSALGEELKKAEGPIGQLVSGVITHALDGVDGKLEGLAPEIEKQVNGLIGKLGT